MKTRRVLLAILFILFAVGWLAPVWSQDIPTNYIQNPNMEHELNVIFWYGDWSPTYGMNGIVSHPDEYMTNLDQHSGNWCMNIPASCWIWVSYPVRGHEEKRFKASFWYRGYMTGYWNFIYRDVGMTEQDLPPALAEYVGADSVYHEFGGQDALRFEMWGDDKVARDGWTEDWTYFEFVWDFPGTILGGNNTSMWYGQNVPAYIDDLYYGEWYDGQYEGEEPFGFINGDFEKSEINGEWLYNLAAWDAFRPNDFVSTTQNHTDAGEQSMGLMDYKEVSEDGDTTVQDRNVTYYLPVIGAEGKNMEMSFWYKGNEATMDLFFYDNYGITTDELPLPDNAQLLANKYTDDTVGIQVDSTMVYDYTNPVSADTAQLITILMPESLGAENFDAVSGTPALLDWNWSGYAFFDYNDWPGQITAEESFSPPKSLWLPGDPNWSGAEGTLPGIVDGGAYTLSFMFKGDIQLVFKFSGLKYDLVTDPDGIVPENGDAHGDDGELWFHLSSEEWDHFSYSWEVGTWLADSGIASPAGLVYDLVGAYDLELVGYVDDLEFLEVVVPVDVLAKQDFDGLDGAKPAPMDWNWSGGNFFGWNDWDGEMVESESFSAPTSFWLPGDPAWTGSAGIISDIVDDAAYAISFRYKGKLQFTLDLGADLKYDVATDPDGIIPEEAVVEGRTLIWNLDAGGWSKFSYAWEQDTWLADSSLTSADLNFAFVGTYTSGDNGWVDDLLVEKSKEGLGAESLIESSEKIFAVYGLDTILYDTTYLTETLSEKVIVDEQGDLEPLAIHWTLPAVDNWTEWKYTWTNPSTDIGGNLTLFLDNTLPASPFYLTPEVTTLDPEHAGWTFFDDFVYQMVTGVEPVLYQELHTYPNPAVDVMYLSIDDQLSRIDIYNSVGQMVKSLNRPDRKVNISDLTSGIYMLNVTDVKGTIYRSKFIKQ
jgi:hypothetical protein